ncbi:type II toxin-antitoxin system HipA family toxin [Flectobacillus longus]|uniref:type II toxin-antitoxin system HipA family toxin n=1 Tax=Flectobacillus longus TaxID=2984207 RepID=UPI0024B84D67|nr:HipA domain-containing protein [Flectobacillus longus]MDI9881062.1 HipA domain-containing protein [Flectobacillus longus]
MHFDRCPGTLTMGYDAYSKTCLNQMFDGRKVSPILPYLSPVGNINTDELFQENHTRISVSGVQEKFSMLLEKNRLRLVNEGERGAYILKPIPSTGKNAALMPANEHLTMQIARQVFDIETAENVLIFFQNEQPAYLTKRFDLKKDGSKWAKEDFASLAGRTPQTHGTHYKYQGNYLELFMILKKYVPAYSIEAPKLWKLLLFNYLFSNGDAHYKNFSLIETELGDFKLSPAYDLLNSRLHINDGDFALEDGLLPKIIAKGKIYQQFILLAQEAQISTKTVERILDFMFKQSERVSALIESSFLPEKTQRNYWQAYQTRLNKLTR